MTPQIDEHQDVTEAMAAEFTAVLKTWLSPEEMQEVVCRNEGEHDPTICHSHDFCDANMTRLFPRLRLGKEVLLRRTAEN